MRMELPAAKAGAILWATRLSGKLNGVMPRIGPIGNRRVIPQCDSMPGDQSSGQHFTTDSFRFLRRNRKGLNGPTHLPARIGSEVCRPRRSLSAQTPLAVA